MEGGDIDGEVEGVVNDDIASHPFSKSALFGVDFELAGEFLTPSRVGSILKFWLILLLIDRAHSQLSKTPLLVFIRPIWREKSTII